MRLDAEIDDIQPFLKSAGMQCLRQEGDAHGGTHTAIYVLHVH